MTDEHAVRALQLLRRHLEERVAAGATRAWISPDARAALREMLVAARRKRNAPAGPRPRPPASETAVQRPASSAPPVFGAAPPGSDRPARLEALKTEVLACPNYRALIDRGSLRPTMVFSVGNPHSPLVFIGEAPGAEEERQGEPFVGPAGQLLTRIIQAMGLERREIYISNIVKFRPAIPGGDQGEKNRKPDADELAAGRPHLLREIGIIEPRVIVTLGAAATEGILEEPVTISRLRGKMHDFLGSRLMPTFHPSYLLRSGSLADRRLLWEDMMQVMDALGLPISEKQRRYFLVAP